ncbi:flavodoxin family protein [Chloroflexota bacterium]
MQILVLSGSRNPEGETARAIEAISKGVAKAGGNTERFFLPALNLEPCRQCESDGWGVCRQEERCIIDDDFSSLVDKIKSSDVIVFATPVYFRDLSESMRGFLDRLRRICAFKTPKPTQDISAVGLCLAGGRGGGGPSACLNLENILQTCGFDVVDMIPLRRQNLDAKLQILELIGAWLATKPTSK